MKNKLRHPLGLEILTALLFLVFLFPFLIVLINAAKSSFEITQSPMSLPENWSMIGKNMVSIWTNPNIQYPSSFKASIIITVFSLLCIIGLSSQAAWVLVRTKTKTSQVIFYIFVAAMVIPFQIVMFPLLSWFKTIYQVTGIKLLRTYPGMILAYVGFGSSLSVFLYHGFIKSIPFELEEAAKIDGCRPDENLLCDHLSHSEADSCHCAGSERDLDLERLPPASAGFGEGKQDSDRSAGGCQLCGSLRQAVGYDSDSYSDGHDPDYHLLSVGAEAHYQRDGCGVD